MKIKELRESRGILQIELAKQLGIARNTLSQYETGKRSPDLDTLQKIADYFNVSIERVLGSPEKNEPDIVAFHKNKSGDFTEEEREEIDNFIQYIISKRKKE